MKVVMLLKKTCRSSGPPLAKILSCPELLSHDNDVLDLNLHMILPQ